MNIRKATRDDLHKLVQLIANDPLGKTRERIDQFEKYASAFDLIMNDSHQELLAVEDEHGEIIGTFQLTFIQYLAHEGRYVMQVESVHVREDQRSKGIGAKMFQWAFQHAKEKGASRVQLTSDKRRPDAKRFYERLGFVASHEGFKLNL